MRAGASQFLAQLIGLGLAVAISVAISHRLGASAEADAFLLGRRLVTGLQEVLVQVLTLVFLPMVAMRAGQAALLRLGCWVAAAGVLIAVAFGALSGPIVAAIAPEMQGEAAAMARRVIVVLSGSLPLALVGVLMGAALNLSGRFGWPAMARLAPRAMVLGVFLAGLGASQSVMWAAAGFVAGNAVALLMMLPLVRPVEAPKSQVAPHVGAALLLVAGAQGALWLETALAARAGVGGITLLEMGQRVAALLGNTLALALVMPAFAKWTARPDERTGRHFWKLAAAGTALLVLAQGLLMILAPRIVANVLGQGALGAEGQEALLPVIWILALAPFATLLSRLLVVWRITGAGGHLGQVGLAVVVDLCVRSILGLTLLPAIGVQAVALGMVLGPLASAAVLGALSRRDLRGEGVGFLPVLGSMMGLAAGVVVMWAAPMVFPWFAEQSILSTLALTSLSGVAALGVFTMWIRWRGLVWVFRF
ncbi:MAG: hypothetical protein MRY81_00970 [Donghicola eburneus]|nr:hypothetical protein [Donghicola eburneus]MCI5038233.1 hypothetical protein [Donghicola eburneus]